MHIVIMGCGRVGSTLALALEAKGHDVAVVDQEADAFRRLGSSFSGRRVTGIGFDQETLLEAGIEQADGFAAVSSGDNSNIISARLAREQFGVDNVVARIYDPARAEVYERLGIPTVATVSWTADQILRKLLPPGSEPLWRDPSGHVALARVSVNAAWIGHPTAKLESASGARIAFLTRLGEGILPNGETVLQEGDLVHVVLREDAAAKAEAVFGAGPTAGSDVR
ncbi:TrkA family potassium uptake protein [Sporichthya sp.]|uniref:potassium channel family protein n=1 Tax=Sporichthya sp. TaxID=65475 RepID=UPI0017DB3D77|nr:TrkA family potassium uptake protein [Sporichthya sp.]MBA3744542.1 TrkA family potassium uptake protein [Sporichthya sp.]